MDEKDQRAAFLSALTTEHFVMQTSMGVTINEAQARANTFIGALTGTLVAMGFVTQFANVLLPFVATVFPAIFVMGVLTVLRLTDISVESAQAQANIARIRREYRNLGAESEAFFASKFGRWPESPGNPALRLGSTIAYWTSIASMIAAIDALVGAAGVTLILRLTEAAGLSVALLVGAGFAAVVLGAYLSYQKFRIVEVDAFTAEEGLKAALEIRQTTSGER
jgi:hypothetical protein